MHLHDVHFESPRLIRAKLPRLKGQARAPADTVVVQRLGDEKPEGFRGAAHAKPVRQAEALEVEVLEVVVAVGGGWISSRIVRSGGGVDGALE